MVPGIAKINESNLLLIDETLQTREKNISLDCRSLKKNKGVDTLRTRNYGAKFKYKRINLEWNNSLSLKLLCENVVSSCLHQISVRYRFTGTRTGFHRLIHLNIP